MQVAAEPKRGAKSAVVIGAILAADVVLFAGIPVLTTIAAGSAASAAFCRVAAPNKKSGAEKEMAESAQQAIETTLQQAVHLFLRSIIKVRHILPSLESVVGP